MGVFFISYRISGPKPDHHTLSDHIEALATHPASHPFDNAWIIAHSESESSVKTDLEKTGFQSTDKLLVIRLTDLKDAPQFAQLNIDEESLQILEHKPSSFVRTVPGALFDEEKQHVFVVSCDHAESNTDDIDKALHGWADRCSKVTTSTWVLLRKDGQFDKLCERVVAFGGRKFSGLVAQLNRGFPSEPGPLVRLLGAASTDRVKAAAFMNSLKG